MTAHAYTPGLLVSPDTPVSKRRILPLKGDVVVQAGDEVGPETVVARTHLPGGVQTVNIAATMGLPAADILSAMLKKEGDAVTKGELIAASKSFFGMFKSQATAPVTGTLESVSTITGQAMFREPPIPVEVRAYIRGRVSEVVPREGVVVETWGAFVQGIFGIGGETHGPIEVVVDGPDKILGDTFDFAPFKPAGKILIGGSLATYAAIQNAIKAGARGLVVGGIHDSDLKRLLGVDLGVAITGNEKIGVTLVVTEGFGIISMARKTFDLLGAHRGQEASINGTTQIRAGVMRPEVIIATESGAAGALPPERGQMRIGSPLRAIREPYFGKLGTVAALPPELQALETEAHVRVVEVAFADGTKAILPRANIELIEM